LAGFWQAEGFVDTLLLAIPVCKDDKIINKNICYAAKLIRFCCSAV